MIFPSHSKLLLGGVLSVTIMVVGCKGIGSNLVHRNQTNSAWEHEKLKGIPITLEIPTHVRVSIIQRRSFYGPNLMPVAHCGSEVKYDFIRTKKIFTVDPRTPGAGTADWKIDLEEQYIKKAESNISDVTILQTSTAIANVISSGGFGTLFKPAGEDGDAPPATADSGLVEDPDEKLLYKHIDSVVATKIFDIEDPMFEIMVAEFVKCHVEQEQCPVALGSHSWLTDQIVEPASKVPLVPSDKNQ